MFSDRFQGGSTRRASAHRQRRRHPRGGFTLIEIMVVLVLLGLLATVVTVNVRHYMIKGKVSAARVDMAAVEHALSTFYSEYGRYPTNEEGLAVLTTPTAKVSEPLLTKLPVDPWGRPYLYFCPGRNAEAYEVVTYGADGREGGTGADADLSTSDASRQESP